MQLGPQIRIRFAAAIFLSSDWYWEPSAPVSAKPLDSIMTPATPLAAHSSTDAGTSGAGMKMIARSSGSETELMEG